MFIHTITGSGSRNVLITSFSLTPSLTTTQPPYLHNLIIWQEEHPAWVKCLHGYLSGAWCKWLAYGPADFNANPERCLVHNLEILNFSSQQLQCSTQVKYLGCQFKCSTCKIDTKPFICKFYGNFNNILRVTGSKRNEMMVVHLIKSYCLPSLLYSCET